MTALADRRSVRRTQRRTLDPQQLQRAVELRHQRLHLRHIARLLHAPFSTVARTLSRRALSLDRRYLQYPDLLDRVIRVAALCERAHQPYQVVATEPDAATARLAEQKLLAVLGHSPRHLLLTPMDTVDIGAAALQDSHSRALDPDGIPALIHSAPCGTSGFHRPYYLHIAPNGGLRSCLYAPAAGWLGNVQQQSLPALLNVAGRNPVVQLFASGDFDAFIARAITPWRHLYADPHHACAASALVARIAGEVQRLELGNGGQASADELEQLHCRLAAEYRFTSPRALTLNPRG